MTHRAKIQSRLYGIVAFLALANAGPTSAQTADDQPHLSSDTDQETPKGEPSEKETKEKYPPGENEIPKEELPGEEIPEEENAPPAVRWVDEPAEPVLPSPLISETEEESAPQGPRYVLQRIVIQGNKKTMHQVILRHIEIRPGEVFSADDPRLEQARYRLLASGLFYSVEFSLKRGSRRGFANLLVNVKERNTIVVQDIVFGFSEVTPFYGSLDVAERSFLGSGVKVSAAAVFSKKQYGYQLRFSDDHFLNSDFGLHAEGLFSHARDFFGNEKVCVNTCDDYSSFATIRYNRAGLRLGTGYTLLSDNFFSISYRFEVINSDIPPAGSHISFGERQPIVFGHLLPGDSILSSIILGVVRDTRNSFILASTGYRTAFEVELSTEMVGSNYDYSKFTLSHDTYFHLGRNHSIKLGVFVGLIMGEAPFFNQFFVGDFSAFVPSRVLEMNFSHLKPNLLDTSVVEMRYEDLAASIGVEYSAPFYRGEGFLYGINGFIGLGLFALASKQYLQTDPKGYEGYQVVPMDLTMDLGIKVDTEIGLFVVSLANLFRLIPGGEEAAEK